MSESLTGYELSRQFTEWAFENPDVIKPIHYAVYFFAIEHNNRLGWRDKFGFPSQMTMEAIGVKGWKTYINAFNDLVDWGFFEVYEYSKNQYSSNIIGIVKNVKAQTKALTKALQKHRQKHIPKHCSITDQSTYQSIASIDKPINLEPINLLTREQGTKAKRFTPPDLNELKDYFFEKVQNMELASLESEKFFDFYNSKGWMVGKNKMKSWKSSVHNWIKGIDKYQNGTSKKGNNGTRNFSQEAALRALAAEGNDISQFER